VNKVLSRCEEKYVGVFERCAEVGWEVYEGQGVEGLEGLGREEVARWFKGAR
jgi:hypothetical protein